jgi:cytochrome c oxidase assembly protein Cox11
MIITEDYYGLFIIFIISIKIIYYIVCIYHFICKIFNIGTNIINNDYLLNTLNIVFNTSMALLLLYLFNPYYKTNPITNSVKGLLFLYAFILLIGNFQFINENNLVKIIKNLLNLN